MKLYHANKPQVWLGVIGDGGMLRIYNKAGKAIKINGNHISGQFITLIE